MLRIEFKILDKPDRDLRCILPLLESLEVGEDLAATADAALAIIP